MTTPIPPDMRAIDKGLTHAWHEDPVILRRLKLHEELTVKHPNWTNAEMAEATGVSIPTVQEDRKRIKLLWLEYIGSSMEELRAGVTQTYRQVQAAAWEKFDKTGKATWLKIIIDAEDRVSKLLGLEAPRRIKTDHEIHMTWGDPLRSNQPAHHQVIDGVYSSIESAIDEQLGDGDDDTD